MSTNHGCPQTQKQIMTFFLNSWTERHKHPTFIMQLNWGMKSLILLKKYVGTFELLINTQVFKLQWDCLRITPDNQAAIEYVNVIDEHRSKIVINRVFDCHLSPDWRQMAIQNTVSTCSFFDPRLTIVKSVFDCAYPVWKWSFNNYLYYMYGLNVRNPVFVVSPKRYANQYAQLHRLARIPKFYHWYIK